MIWPDLCDEAGRAPDFDVVYRLSREEAVDELLDLLPGCTRLEIEQAYDDWPPVA